MANEEAASLPKSPIEGEEVPAGVIRVIVADSEPIFRVGVRKIIAIEDDMRIVAQVETVAATLAAGSRYAADVLLFESSLSDSPAEVIGGLLAANPSLKIILVTSQPTEEEVVGLLGAGVRGIVTRSIAPDLLIKCIRKVYAGETWLDNQGVNWVIEAYRAQAAQLTSPRARIKLSPKEIQIISGVTQGLRNKDIAQEVGTTEQVVKNYLRKVYDKLGVSDRLELALYCMHHRLLESYPKSDESAAPAPAIIIRNAPVPAAETAGARKS
jgi:DNA-binding NarL/FixJ family response regulator